MRTSASQFLLMVDYMERNGDLSKRTETLQGKADNARCWVELTTILNADATGDTKTLEKWRKVWSDLKNNTKKKSARIHRAARGTGGGPPLKLKLTDLENRVLSIIGPQAATGINIIPEIGLEEEMSEVAPNNSESPSILVLGHQASSYRDWNLAGTSTHPPALFPPLLNSEDLVDRDENATATIETPVLNEVETRPGVEMSAAASARQAPQSPTPLPLTPRRRRRRYHNQSSPIRRRTRTQTQSDLARQAFVAADCEWRAFQQEAERERNRLRESELRMQERWLDLLTEFLALGNRIVSNWEKK